MNTPYVPKKINSNVNNTNNDRLSSFFTFFVTALVSGGVLENVGGGVIFGILCVILRKQSKRISILEKAQSVLPQKEFDLGAKVPENKPLDPVVSIEEPKKDIQEPIKAPQAFVVKSPESKNKPIYFNPPPPKVKNLNQPSIEDVLTKNIRDFFTQGNPIARIGALILFFGVGFALKLAAEEGFIPPVLRLIAAAVLAIGLLVGGWKMRESRAQFAAILQGTGFGVFYITTFIAYKMYHYIPAPLAFVFFVGVTILSGLIAVLINTRWIAFFSILGGFLAPILSSNGGGNHIALFSYMALLNIGIFAMSFYRSWHVLNITGFIFTYLISIFWASERYRPELYYGCQFFIVLFLLLFTAINIVYHVRHIDKSKNALADALLTFGTPFLFSLVQWRLVSNFEYGTAVSSAMFGLMHVSIAQLLLIKYKEKLRALVESYLTIGFIFFTITVPFIFDQRVSSGIWALEATALIWNGIRQRRFLVRAFGISLLPLSALLFLINPDARGDIFFNQYLVGILFLTFGHLVSAAILIKASDQVVKNSEKQIAIFGLCCAVFWWTFGGLQKVYFNLSSWRDWFFELIPSTLWVNERSFDPSIYGIFASITLFGFWAIFKNVGLPGRKFLADVFLPVHFLVILGFFLPNFPEFFNQDTHVLAFLGVFSWPLFFLLNYYILYIEEKELSRKPSVLLHQVSLLFLIFISTWEIAWLADRFGSEDWKYATLVLVPAIFSLWVCARLNRDKSWPYNSYRNAYDSGVLVPIFWSMGLILLFDFISPSRAPLPYIPLLNALDISQIVSGVAFVTYLIFINKSSKYIDRVSANSFLGVWVFVWATSTLLRIMHHMFGIPWDLSEMFRSNIVQATVSIFWSILALALMIISHQKSSREIWKIGAILIGVVVLKLFFVDLSNHATIGRIAAFLGVGGLMLGIGYFAPIPPVKKINQQDNSNEV